MILGSTNLQNMGITKDEFNEWQRSRQKGYKKNSLQPVVASIVPPIGKRGQETELPISTNPDIEPIDSNRDINIINP